MPSLRRKSSKPSPPENADEVRKPFRIISQVTGFGAAIGARPYPDFYHKRSGGSRPAATEDEIRARATVRARQKEPCHSNQVSPASPLPGPMTFFRSNDVSRTATTDVVTTVKRGRRLQQPCCWGSPLPGFLT